MNVIESNNIRLRKAKPKDLESMFQNIWSDETIAKFMSWKTVTTYEEAKEKLNASIEFQKSNLAYFVCLKDTDEAIGFAGIKEVRPGVYSDSGLCIANKCQGLGYGKELLSLLLDLAFIRLNADEFIYGCMSNNEKSKNLCMHFGFKYIGSKDVVRSWDNYLYKDDEHSLTKEKYMSLRKRIS